MPSLQKTHRRWTEKELQFIRVAYPSPDYPIEQMVSLLGRTQHSIQNRASRMGLLRPICNVRGHWEQWEDDFLKDTYPRREWSINQIAAKLERTSKATAHRAATLGYQKPRDRLNRNDIALLREQGMNPHQIAKRLSYTDSAVRYAIRAMAREVEHG